MFNLIYADLYVPIGTDYNVTISLGDELYSDYEFFAAMRKTYTSLNTYNFTISEVDSYPKKVELSMPFDVTSALTAGRYYYDVFARNNDTQFTYKVQEGQVHVLPTVIIPPDPTPVP